jgi:hypothetical protein
MGYESRLYVVNKTTTKNFEGTHFYAEKIATFDLSKIGEYEIFHKYPATDCYIYADDGNTEILKDCYGEELIEIPIPDAIKILEDLIAKYPNYRRWRPCLSLLKGFNPDQWDNLVVLHYGY